MSRLREQASPFWIACGAAVTGVTTYVALAATARAVGGTEYDGFAFYWSFILIAGFGAFLPVEQVLARRRVADPAGNALLARGTGYGIGAALLTLVVVAAFDVAGAVPAAASDLLTTAAYAIALTGFAVQFAARGVLAGAHRLRDYSLVIAGDAVARTGAVIVLGALGVDDGAAFALAVAGSALLAGVLGAWFVVRSHRDPVAGRPRERRLAHEAAALTVAMVCMQALINSPVLIAGAVDDPHLSAGELLAVATLARLAVFVAQAAQASYVGRIAAAHRAGQRARTRRLVELVAGGAVGLAVLTVLGGAVVGPALVRLLFGGEFQVSRTECVLVAAGVAAFVCASVANDLSVALSRHRRAGRTWLVSVAAATAVLLTVDDPLLRSTLPLLVGAAVATVAIAVPMASRGGRSAPPVGYPRDVPSDRRTPDKETNGQ